MFRPGGIPWVLAAAAGLLVAPTGAAQQSPYAGLEDRSITTLSAEETAAYLAGDGMGLALAAELNGLPGPRHVLELADSLDLSATQRAAVQATFDAMLLEARRLGTEIVAAERELDAAFASGTIDRAALETMTAHIAELHGRLRCTHLAAHLELRGVLTPSQSERYTRLRGYGPAAATGDGHDPSHRHPGPSH
jgi:Spy/CpxP family protein refolding chaperone